MNDKYISIITNFGCHYTCPYCIVKNNNSEEHVKEFLNSLHRKNVQREDAGC